MARTQAVAPATRVQRSGMTARCSGVRPSVSSSRPRVKAAVGPGASPATRRLGQPWPQQVGERPGERRGDREREAGPAEEVGAKAEGEHAPDDAGPGEEQPLEDEQGAVERGGEVDRGEVQEVVADADPEPRQRHERADRPVAAPHRPQRQRG